VSKLPGTPELSLIIPAYNEARRIRSTLESVRDYLDAGGYRYELLVGADGTDGTRERAREVGGTDPGLTVFGGDRRGGKGRAIREGVARARGRIIGFMDADYKTPIEELPKLLAWLERGYDVVIGSRVGSEAVIEVRQPFHRRIGSRVFGIGMHLTLGLWDIIDTQCGFKVFTGGVARDLFSRQRIDGYMFDVEILYLAQRSGYRIKQVGVRWRDDGDSRLDLVADNWTNVLDILRIRLARYPERLSGVQPSEEVV
jgi:dolichyl-phosphate beta-glucosyltransferase